MRRAGAAAFAASFALLAGCATPSPGDAAAAPVFAAPVSDEPAPGRRADVEAAPESEARAADALRPRAIFKGIASWYGPGFHGRQTANGEIFDQHAMTAAHRTLPLASLVRVTRIDTGRSVLLRINDRGPYVEGRVIDLSLAAAEALGFIEEGLAEVRVEALGPADPRDRAAVSGFFDPANGAPTAASRVESP